MNFYASQEFLEAAAAVYFKNRETAIENVRIGEDVLRLLVVDGRKIISRLMFLDFHKPLAPHEIQGKVRKGHYAPWVSRAVIAAQDWNEQTFQGRNLAPFVDWAQFESFDAYYEQLLARHHGLVRDRERRGRALAKQHGAVSFTRNDHRDDVLPLACAWKGQQLQEMGYPDIFDDPKTMEFFTTLRERGLLVSSTLRAGGRLASAWLGFIHDGIWSGWIFAYDPALKKHSAGHQLLMRMLEESARLGHKELDFSIGAADYKMFYASHGRVLANIGKPPVGRAAELFARKVLIENSPALFTAALRVKSFIANGLRRPAPLQTAAICHRGT